MGRAVVIVLDTHVWLWWLSEFEPLSRQARKVIEAAIEKSGVYISCISAWEVAQLAARGRLQLTPDPRDWIARSESLPFITFVPVDNQVAVRSVQLAGALHQDPADRIIIATAQVLGVPLVTKDAKLARYPHVKTVW